MDHLGVDNVKGSGFSYRFSFEQLANATTASNETKIDLIFSIIQKIIRINTYIISHLISKFYLLFFLISAALAFFLTNSSRLPLAASRPDCSATFKYFFDNS